MAIGFCSIGGSCYSGWWVWDLGKLKRSEMTSIAHAGEFQFDSYAWLNFWFHFYEFGVQRTPKLAARVQFPFGWNIYLLFNSDIVNLVCKTREGDR